MAEHEKTWNDFFKHYCECGHPGLGCYCHEWRVKEADAAYDQYKNLSGAGCKACVFDDESLDHTCKQFPSVTYRPSF